MATEAEEIDNFRATAVVPFVVKRSIIDPWVYSQHFFVRNVSWRILADCQCSMDPQLITFSLSSLEDNFKFSINTQIQASILGTKLQKKGSHKFKSIFSFSDWVWRVPKSELPVGDELTLELKLSADEPEGIQFEPPKEKLKLALQPLESAARDDDLLSLLNSGQFSDVTFVLAGDGSKVKAHKIILAARSQVFARMLSCDMKEARDGEIEIDDMGASALKILLRYIYSGLLDFPKDVKVDMDLCKELINAGDKYDLKNLKEYVAMSLTEFVSFENAVELFRFVKVHKAEAATKALRSYFVRNVNQIADKL